MLLRSRRSGGALSRPDGVPGRGEKDAFPEVIPASENTNPSRKTGTGPPSPPRPTPLPDDIAEFVADYAAALEKVPHRGERRLSLVTVSSSGGGLRRRAPYGPSA
ncbi:hypothetical protein GCM10023196_003420 [Actinoallomurus vinaceus]|uniref:Uncharacterized protein n=1 Tax=Actinoallomurus vinaceus TaxID=1080074 RepID=A0ABP8TZD7_9ACTN